MSVISLKATNQRGDSISFTDQFKLVEIVGISGLTAENFYSSSSKDGSTLTGTRINNRDVEIRFHLMKVSDEYSEDRIIELLRVFNPKLNPIRLDVTTKANRKYFLNANVDTTPLFSNENPAYTRGMIQLSCSDPFIYDVYETRRDIALWIRNLEFPLELRKEGIEIGYRSPSLILDVINRGQMSTGMTVTFKAKGTLLNPSLTNATTGEFIKLNTAMEANDEIIVSTFDGNKFIELKRGLDTIDAFNFLDLESTFLQLEVGSNLLRYDAEQYLENLEVEIKFRNKFLGV